MIRTRTRQACAVATAVIAVVSVVGCQWTFGRYDAANTGANPNETAVGVANVASLAEEWTTPVLGPLSSVPIVVGSKVFVSSDTALYAFDASGRDGCGGVPKVCQPLWSAPGFGRTLFALGGQILRASPSGIQAFDPAGVTGCSGSPEVCSPLWTSTAPAADAVAIGSELYAPTGLNGTAGAVAIPASSCSGTCLPLRTYANTCRTPSFCGGTWTAAEGDTLVATDAALSGLAIVGNVAAYDRTGSTGCAGAPAVCSPRWSTPIDHPEGPPAITGGTVYQAVSSTVVGPAPGISNVRVLALDEGTGTIRWSAPLPTEAVKGTAVGNGFVHVVGATQLSSFADGSCAGTCPIHHRALLGAPSSTPPAIANGLVFVGTTAGVDAFDAAGSVGCTGTPVTCSPLAHVSGSVTNLSIALGNVWAAGGDNKLHVIGLD